VVREALAREYYRVARRAIDAGNEKRYLTYLVKGQRELIAAIRIDPTDPRPHTQMGIILSYRGDLDGARTSFLNALRLFQSLAPKQRASQGRGGFLYTNLAHTEVYRGRLEDAEKNLETGRKEEARKAEVARIETLLAWRSGDPAKARTLFAAAEATPGFADTWDAAPLPQKMKSFDDFCAVCCRNPSCGPHLADACQKAGYAVKERAVTRDTLVEEMRLERERRAKLKEIYATERRVSIEIQPDAPADPPAEPGR
jgi:tetratricopeptide (TPR) repeat protein